MRLRSKFIVTGGAILAMTLGFAFMTKAAPLGGLTAAVSAVQKTGETSASDCLPEKAYYHRRYYHRHYYRRPYYHRRYYHRGYYHRRYYHRRYYHRHYYHRR